jgi:formate-nitrite transporter family protein
MAGGRAPVRGAQLPLDDQAVAIDLGLPCVHAGATHLARVASTNDRPGQPEASPSVSRQQGAGDGSPAKPAERRDGRRRAAPSAKVVYEAIRKEGEEELGRSTSALAWSGVAAGLSMGFSLLAQGLLRQYLPETQWAPLVIRLGYSVGFLVVVLGRQQLFTENTLTAIIPLLAARTKGAHGTEARVGNVLRLWSVVLAANLLGAFAFAAALAKSGAFSQELRSAFDAISLPVMQQGPLVNLVRGVFAGWLIALMVWLLPVARSSRLAVIIIITYVVGLGELTHVVAGAVEVLYLPFRGEARFLDVVAKYLGPALLGNVLGGVTLTSALNHAQVTAGEARH